MQCQDRLFSAARHVRWVPAVLEKAVPRFLYGRWTPRPAVLVVARREEASEFYTSSAPDEQTSEQGPEFGKDRGVPSQWSPRRAMRRLNRAT